MLAYPIAVAAIVLLGQGAQATTHQQKMEFMRAMKATPGGGRRRAGGGRRKLDAKTPAEFKSTLHGSSKKSSQLRKKIIEKATVVKPGDERKLDQAYNYKYSSQRDGSDDYFMAYGEWENDFGFDASQYSLSYHRCAAVRQFDDQLAAEEDSNTVFATKHFAVFRFCPEATCMGFVYNDNDCGCEQQCEAIQANQYNGNANNANDDDQEACEEGKAVDNLHNRKDSHHAN